MSIFLGALKEKELQKTSPSRVDLSPYLKKDGSVPLENNLDLGKYIIVNMKTYPQNNSDAASKKYVDDESEKNLDLDCTRQLNGDLDVNDNSIVGIYDINADNSVPSKKFVKDEDKKRDTKITWNKGNITRNKNTLDVLKNRMMYSHYSHFLYQNPVSGVYKEPFSTPAGWDTPIFFLTGDYSENTNLRLLGLSCDTDTTLGSSLSLSCEGIFYKTTGGFDTKVFVTSLNLSPYRMVRTNKFFLDLSYNFKNIDNSKFMNWKSFQIKVAVPWSNNETILYFSVDYY